MTEKNQIALLLEEESLINEANLLAAKLKIPVVSTYSSAFNFFLCLSKQGLALIHTNKMTTGKIQIDFLSGKTDYRRQHSGVKQEIAKAVGIKKDYKPNVLDATAGLAADAFVLASVGCNITLVEQSPILAALVEDALKRAAENNEIAEIILHMHLINANSIQYMQQLSDKDKPDVVYLDPMFPERKKSALVKKEMQVLQKLLGNKTKNTDQLLETTLAIAKKRVVVKRPRLAETLTDKKPDFIIKGKTCRFDVYLV